MSFSTKYENTESGRLRWIDAMVDSEIALHRADFWAKRWPTFFEMKILVAWVHEDCSARWGANYKWCEQQVVRILEAGFHNEEKEE